MTMVPRPPHTINPFLFVLIVVFGLLGGYVYYRQASADASDSVPLPAAIAEEGSSFIRFKDFRFDFSFFSGEAFSSLKGLETFPLDPGSTGKQDLFAPR